ncbi:MAG TPA: fumarylacetoacetate hydrolase family protein [Candidatus Acidoferrales bacterium]|jgi:2-keto-4-pentenoate hydratase|nr:fumarylacetoacetate hydrolase family protein [Candidatus Acidoferrales bacterium]
MPTTLQKAWDDPRIKKGMQQQFCWRRELLAAGKKPLGWKLAFGGPAALVRLRINAPLVGFLMADAVVPSGSTISLAGWKKSAAEPELTVYLGKDLSSGADRETTMDAIAGLGAAIELADVDHPPDDVEGTLARNIYQRHVILGGCDATRPGGNLSGLNARVFRSGAEIANTSDLQALTGELISTVGHVANLLAHFGETLRAGQIIIAGSITLPIWVQPGETIGFHLEPLNPIFINFAAAP